MKKIILILTLSLFAFADFPKMETLLIQQSSIAIGVDAFIKNRGTIPTDITALVNAGYLPSDFNASNPVDGDNITFSVSNQQIFINSQIESDKVDAGQIDYYVNTMAYRDLGRVSKVENSQLVSYYTLSSIGALNLNVNSMFGLNVFKGNSDPTLYTSATNGNFWFSSTFPDNMYQTYLRDSDVWKSLDSYSKNFDPISKTFVNTKTIPLTKSYWDKQKVNVSKQAKAIKCNNGETYNSVEDRCEAYTSNACDYGYSYNTKTKRCEYYNICPPQSALINGKCYQTTYSSAIKSAIIYNSYGVYCNGDRAFAWNVSWNYPFDTYTYPISVYWNGEYVKTLNSQSDITVKHNQCDGYGAYLNDKDTTIGCFSGKCDRGSILTISKSQAPCNKVKYITYGGTGCENGCVAYYCSNTSIVSCPAGYSKVVVDGRTVCRATTIVAPVCPDGGTLDSTNKVCYLSPTCAGKKMPVSPYYDTPYYGNNGVCYSDAGLYCQKTGVSWDGIYTCYDHSEHCDDTTWNLDYSNDVCQKYQYSCNAGYYRYGLSESPTNSDATDLYNRIANPDDKLNTVVQYILKQDVNVNDNAGALCASLRYSDFSQPTISPTYTIDGFDYSAF